MSVIQAASHKIARLNNWGKQKPPLRHVKVRGQHPKMTMCLLSKKISSNNRTLRTFKIMSLIIYFNYSTLFYPFPHSVWNRRKKPPFIFSLLPVLCCTVHRVNVEANKRMWDRLSDQNQRGPWQLSCKKCFISELEDSSECLSQSFGISDISTKL